MATASKAAGISLVNVTKRYGDFVAVDHVNLSVRPGEFLTLLGPSGSGKSTTLMMIAGFEMLTAGEIRLDERDITFVPPNQRNLGVVFQNYALFPHMTVEENVAFPLSIRKLSRQETRQRVGRVLDLVQLSRFGRRYPRQLSGGQQQRVALGRALVYEPPVVLMDEPLGALDRKLRESMQLEIKHLQQSLGTTVIYVTHDQEEALTMSDRIAVMRDGRVEQCGPPDEIYEQPATPFVAGFLGEANFLHGVAAGQGGGGISITLAEGVTVRGVSPVPVASGQAVQMAIRPERLATVPAGTAVPPDSNALPAVVKEVVYLGEAIKLRLQAKGIDQTVVVKHANRGDRPAPRLGEEVTVVWASAMTWVYPQT